MSTNHGSSQSQSGKPAVRVPPLLAGAVLWLLMWAVARALPSLGTSLPWTGLVAAVLIVAGIAIAIAGVLEFRRVRTTPNPMRPERASALVTGGIYRYTRNPMYLGFAVATLGWAACLGHVLAPLGVPAFIGWMNRFQIPAEERALAALFGDAFERYRREVRRWL